ncbi:MULTISPECIES: hypothetical protein [Sorangium]|uniref:hypothetical protein n=1 Tax=Sorangium TaxID=39643 RepID=UPI003D9C4E7A
MAKLDLREQDIAARCGVSRSTAGHWRTGHAIPRDQVKVVLRDAYGIPIDSWMVPHATAPAMADC